MDITQALTTIAQLALGLAGFTGIAIAFTRRPGDLTPLEAYRLTILFATTLGALFLALIPFGLALLPLSEPGLWRIASLAFAFFEVGLLVLLVPRTIRFMRVAPEIFNTHVLVGLIIGHAATLCLQLANVAGLLAGVEPAAFLWGLLWLLFHGALQFARILFIRPVS